MNWYSKIISNLGELPNMIQYYENELSNARGDVNIYGNVEKSIAALPGITETRFAQLQELEAVLRYMELQLRKIRRQHFQKYLENYNRTLTSRDAEKYTEGENAVVDYECLMNEVALIRNKYLGVIKGLESKNFMLGHLIRLRTAGMEDFTL
jgi:hypothetical protein